MLKKKLKKNEIDPAELKVEKWFSWIFLVIVKGWKRFKIEYKKMMNWYFFYDKHNGDKGDKALHIIGVLFADLFILRVFGLI